MSKTFKFVFVIAVLIFVGGISYLSYRFYLSRKGILSKRQAVFLTNGRVYFGYLSNMADTVVKLKDAYYLDSNSLNPENVKADKILLIKADQELHGPESDMYIYRDQILFFQDIRSDSKVNEAIKKALETK